jgi:hypothetical protein
MIKTILKDHWVVIASTSVSIYINSFIIKRHQPPTQPQPQQPIPIPIPSIKNVFEYIE